MARTLTTIGSGIVKYNSAAGIQCRRASTTILDPSPKGHDILLAARKKDNKSKDSFFSSSLRKLLHLVLGRNFFYWQVLSICL